MFQNRNIGRSIAMVTTSQARRMLNAEIPMTEELPER